MLADIERRMAERNRVAVIGLWQLFATVIAGLCLGDTWIHCIGIFFAIYALSPIVKAD